MDSIFIQLIIIAIVYVLQQFLVRKSKKKEPYKYPDEWINGNIEMAPTVEEPSYEELHYEGKYRMGELPASKLGVPEQQKSKISVVETTPNPWSGRLGNKHMIHGFVMAELFAPPRSINPYKIKKY